MKTRFDSHDELVCVRDCFYANQDFTAGKSVILSNHPMLHHLADCFERLSPNNAPKRSSTLKEQLERRAVRVEEFDQRAAAERIAAEQEKTRRSLAREDRFWQESAELMEMGPRVDLLPDPAAEERAEEIAEEERVARLPEGEEFWDQTFAHLERGSPISPEMDPEQW